jgi:cell division protein FtsB
MGYVVLHFNKAKGSSEARMTAHIERRVKPKNADPEKTHLNRELIEFPSGVTNRTQAIQFRIKTAGIFRKITPDQVRVIRVNVSGSHKDMKRIVSEGRIDEWCKDNLEYFRQEFGEKNIVSAVLHMDEKTPHIHIALVPIVTGKRRKAKEDAEEKDIIRLCADDVLTKAKMKGYQDSYAVAMSKYGLKRGIEGSKAKHRTTQEYYRDTFEQTQVLREEIDELQVRKEEGIEAVKRLQEKEAQERQRLAALQKEANEKQTEVDNKKKQLRQVKNDVVKVGFEKTAKEAGKGVLEGFSSLVGNSKAKKLEVENDVLKQEIEIVQQEKETIRKQAKKDMAEKDRLILEKDSLIVTQKGKLDKLFDYIPVLSEYDFIMRLCELIKIPANIVKQLFAGKDVDYSGSLYSLEHKQNFEAENVKIAIGKSAKDNKSVLAIEGMEYSQWFRLQKDKFLESIGIKVNEPKKTQQMRR